MIGGLILYAASLFLYMLTSHYINFALLAAQGIALALTMVPCMQEVKLSGANVAGAAFVFEIGYSLNILLWSILGEIIGKITNTLWVVLFI